MKSITRSRLFAARLGLGLGALVVTSLHAQTTYTWTGLDTDGIWGTAANWSPGTAAPGALVTDIALFNAADASPAVSLGSTTTIGQLQFATGASAYTLSGSGLTISTAGSAGVPTPANSLISHTAGNIQTITAPLTFTLTTASRNFGVNVDTGGTLTVGSLVLTGGTSFNSNFILVGGGTMNITGAMAPSGFSLNQVQSTAGSTLNFTGTSSLGGGTLWSNGGNIGIGINLASARSLTFGSTGGSIYLTQAVTTSGAANFRPGSNSTVTFGANISGGGTATHAANVNLSSSGALTNANFVFDSKAGNTFVLGGVIGDTNAAGAGTKVKITGAGVVRFSGAAANTSSTPIVIDGGTLELAKTAGVNAIAGGSVTVQNNGALKLNAANQIADTVTMTLDGGTFNTGGFSETLGALSLSAASTIDLGAGMSALVFADSSGATWSSSIILSFVNFTEGVDSIRFGVDGSGLNGAQISQIRINGLAVSIGEDGYLSAIPEPSSYALLAGAAGLMLCAVQRRRACA